MKTLTRLCGATTTALALLLSPLTHAGPDADALGHCLVTSATEADKLALVTWMFTAMSMHPAVAEVAEVADAERSTALAGMADVMTTLLTERCTEEARVAIRNEGPIAMQTSFATLGQVAATELFAHPRVSRGLAELDSYLDHEAMNEALGLRR